MNSLVRTKESTKILTPNQVAEMLMVSPAAVRQWAAKGVLSALTTPGGHRRFKLSDVIDFAESRGMSIGSRLDTVSVLIVDDDVQFTNYMKEMIHLHDERLSVRTAHDGFEAGKLVHSFKPDIIFLDLRMPTMDGFETCKKLKGDTETANIIIVCMTGIKEEEVYDRVIKLGAEDCLTKPLDENDVNVYLDRLLSQ